MKTETDVLMIYPIWVKKGGRGKLQRMLPPLGVLSIASHLETHGFTVDVVDLHAQEIDPDQFRKILRKKRPKFIGITVLSAHFTPAHHIAKICKEELPNSKVYVGGVHAECEPEQMLMNPAIDAVGRGDGELTMLKLCQNISYDKIPGLVYRDEDEIKFNQMPDVEMNLDQFPFPAYDKINLDNYFPPVGSYKDLPAVNVLMTRGCPGKCTFCNSANTKLRSRSVAKTVELLELLRYKHGIRQIYFYDDTFTANPKTVREFCELMIEKKVDVKWICYVRGDMFSDQLAALMARAGCHQVLMGIESGSSELMAKIGKPIDKAKYKKVVETAHKNGIEVRGSFIVGHLDETEETMQESLQFALDLDLDFFQLNVMTPYPGTQLFENAKKHDLLIHEDYSRYGQNECVLKLKNLEPERVVEFEKEAFRKFYFRPKMVAKQLKRLSHWHHLRDLLKATYVIFTEGLNGDFKSQARLQKWLEFDVSKFQSLSKKKIEPRLTFQVRDRSKVKAS